MFKCLNRFTATSTRGIFDYDLNDRTRNNEAKLIIKHFNTSVAQYFYPIKITTNWNALPDEVVNNRTVNSFYAATLHTLSDRIGKVVASHAEGCKVARSNPGCGCAAPIGTMHEALRGTAHEGGECDSQLDLPSLIPLSVAACG